MRTRVVITGLSVVSPIGIGIERFWKNALSGISASLQQRSLEVALLNAFGFGSNNATLVMKRAA